MENRGQFGGNQSIPDIIDPGITIPIYDDVPSNPNEEVNSQQPQKLGSYRVRAGKFSNTLSNLLPSISAKLHHNKKAPNGKTADGMLTVEEEMQQNDMQFRMSGEMMRVASSEKLMAANGAMPLDRQQQHLTPPMESEKLVHFPSTNEYLMNAPRRSNDSYTLGTSFSQTVSRTRNNTMSSQITSISSMAPGPVSAGAIWSNSAPNANDSFQQTQNSTATPSVQDYQQTQYYDQVASPSAHRTISYDPNVSSHNKSNNMLNVPNSTMWSNPNTARQRSGSTNSSIYTDAMQYDQQSIYSHAQSNYTANQAYHDSPLVIDEIDPRSINWVSNDPNVPSMNRINNLLPTATISISNVYPLQDQQPHLNNAVNLTSTSLATLCSKFGEVLSARTLAGINLAIVEFTSVEAATTAMDALQGKEVSMIGAPSFVAFAKILPMHQQTAYYNKQVSNQMEQAPQPLLHEQLYNGSINLQQQGNVSIPVFSQHPQQGQMQSHGSQGQNHNQQYNQGHMSHAGHSHSASLEREQCPFPLPAPPIKGRMDELRGIINSFNVKTSEPQITNLLNGVINFQGTKDTSNFGPVAKPTNNKEFEISKLRELRKAIDSDSMSQLDLEQLAICMLDDLPELSSDYLGNTIVQKLFESCSDIIKDIMLRKTSKYIASMGVHKNGTWACQKIITMAHTPRQINLVTDGIKNYCTPLFDDQFGNYVIQCVLKFGFPWNNFIFESIIANFWTIVQNRYGARAVRACLEAHDIITKEQTLVLSSVIILYSEYLSTNANSALLLTWFLDTCALPKRHTVLASHLTHHIVELCHHRLASLTVLKILNFRGDDVARKIVLQTIFGNITSEDPPQSLKLILNDSSYGPTFIYKVLCMPLLDEDTRMHIIQQVRTVVKDSPSAQQHRRLMEEIGFAPQTSHVQSSQNKHSHRKTGSSVAFNPESAGHMRGPSISSVRSNGSRQTNVAPQNIPSQAINSPGNNTAGGSYLNYPGMFPGGFFGGQPNSYSSNSYVDDDIINTLERLNLNNGTHLSLPKLSFRGQSNRSTSNGAQDNTSNQLSFS